MLKKYGTLIWRLLVVLVLAVILVAFIGKGERLPIIICAVLLTLNSVFFIMVLLKYLRAKKQEQ